MKKLTYILAVVLGLAGMTSCTGEQAQPPVHIPEGGIGNGTWNSPMTCYQASLGSIANDTIIGEDGAKIISQRETSWVTGYIVGYMEGTVLNETNAKFGSSASVSTNIMMASSPDETDWKKCVPVKLPSGVRDALNVCSHPENVGALVTVYGITGQKYFSAYGVRDVSDYKWGDKGKFTPKTIFKATFINLDWAGFVAEDNGNTGMWTLDNRYGLVGKGRFNNVNTACSGSVISPEIFLGTAEIPVLMFEWAGNYFSNVSNFNKYVKICLRTPGGEWTEAEVPTYPNGSSWDFVSSGQIDLSPYKGGRVQVGIFYESTTSVSGTLELRNLQILDAKQFENAPLD